MKVFKSVQIYALCTVCSLSAAVVAGCAEGPSAPKPIGMFQTKTPKTPVAPAPAGSFQVQWRYSRAGLTDVVCADFNGDGKTEIVVRAPEGGVVLNRLGKHLRTIALGYEMDYLATCRARHGAYIIGFGSWTDGVEARDGNGKRLWRYAKANDAVDYACPVDIGAPVGDAVAIGYNGDGGVSLIDSRGKRLWNRKGLGNVWCVGAGRLRRGQPQSILASPDEIWVYDHIGVRMPQFGVSRNNLAVVGADLDGDGIDEVIGIKMYEGGALSVYGADGTLRWRRNFPFVFTSLNRPVIVGRFWPEGRQVLAGTGNGTVVVYAADGQPLSYLKVTPDLQAFAALPHGAGNRDALLIVTSKGLVCYAWKPGRQSPVPNNFNRK